MTNKKVRKVVVKPKKPSNKIYLANLIAVLGNGDVVHLDTTKVDIVDKLTNKPLFKAKEVK